MKRNYTVYIHTNKINGKKYIGITGIKPEKRWKNGKGYHSSSNKNLHFSNAINKYGWDNFEHIILYEGLTQSEACNKEIELIALYDTINPSVGYNIYKGGTCNPMKEETKAKISKANKGRKWSEESKRKFSASLLGKPHPHTAEQDRKISEAKKGYRHTLATKAKISKSHKGIKPNEDTRKKISLNSARNKAVICIETNEEYYCAREAGRVKNVSGTSISAVCRGKRKTAGGYHWKYKE